MYIEPQVEQVAMLGRSRGVDCLLSGSGNGMYFGGFSLDLFEEVSRVMLGNCFPSQRFTCVGYCEASCCSTDTHYVGSGLLKNTVWAALGAKMKPTFTFPPPPSSDAPVMSRRMFGA